MTPSGTVIGHIITAIPVSFVVVFSLLAGSDVAVAVAAAAAVAAGGACSSVVTFSWKFDMFCFVGFGVCVVLFVGRVLIITDYSIRPTMVVMVVMIIGKVVVNAGIWAVSMSTTTITTALALALAVVLLLPLLLLLPLPLMFGRCKGNVRFRRCGRG